MPDLIELEVQKVGLHICIWSPWATLSWRVVLVRSTSKRYCTQEWASTSWTAEKNTETKFQLVYINQVNSVDKNSFWNSLKYSSSFFNLENKSKIKCTVAYRTQIHRLKQECLDLWKEPSLSNQYHGCIAFDNTLKPPWVFWPLHCYDILILGYTECGLK